ncbi:hypothetical protein DH2020_030068 [Rehmannia glutinosa]|uniref:RING-type domain-containing protein n=1 Tax=Rehmannia glutinosa TaxID=99300 RepID=A0ABR0VMJ5_REHGL
MGSKWRKVKLAFGLNLCVYGPKNLVADNDDDEDSLPPSERRSDAALLSPPGDWTSAPPTPASNKLRLSKSLSRSSSKKTCSICLASMRRGDGQAIFTAECSHSFHFHCIASNVKHGNQICPVCRAKWKEIPLQGPTLDSQLGRARINPIDWPHNNDLTTVIRRLPPPRSNSSRHVTPLFQTPEPAIFNDDESLDHVTDSTERTFSNKSAADYGDRRKVDIKTYTEVSAIPRFSSSDSFTVLIHLTAPVSNSWHNAGKNETKLPKITQPPRAPSISSLFSILVEAWRVRLALLKRAMGFVIQNLGPNDRLAVIAFSSTTRRRLFFRFVECLKPDDNKLYKPSTLWWPMEGLTLPRDTYTVNNVVGGQNLPNYQLLLPSSIRPDETSGFKIPVHAFGFGADHDASSMHSISEISGGTFSFIETEGVIQDAFAQCIGGLLSVVVKDLHVMIECVHPTIRLTSLKAGSYPNRMMSNQRIGSIDVGDLYADEERDFLVSMNVPAEVSSHETSLLKAKKLKSRERMWLEKRSSRLKWTDNKTDRAAEAMAQARTAAENGDLSGAVSILENIRKVLSETVSAKSHDRLCIALDAELKEMQERMASRHVYGVGTGVYSVWTKLTLLATSNGER